VVYQFGADALKQVDRVTIVLTLPRVESTRGIPEDGQSTSRVTCSTEDGEFNIEYLDPARVKARTVDKSIRLTQTWAVDGQVASPAFGFRIRESGMGASLLDPSQAASQLREQGKSGEALALLRDQIKKVKEAPVREKMDAQIKQLEEGERRDWADLQAKAFQAKLSRRPELVAQALQGADAFLRQWAGEGGEQKAETLREDVRREVAASPDAEAERARRILDQARKHAESGRRTLAQTMLQTLLTRYPSSEVSAEAQELLKTLNQ
jgi:TolA-binding protein